MEEIKEITLKITPEQYKQLQNRSIYNSCSIDDYIIKKLLDKNLRDSNTEKRSEIIKTRITPTELKNIEKKIKDTNYTMSEFIRAAVLGKEIVIIEDLKDITRNLKGISNNLNQAVTLAHKGHIKEINIEPTKKQVAEIWQLLNLLTAKTTK